MSDTSVLIIAEAGVNHNGDMGMARQLIEVAADAGASLVKFQTFTAERLVTPQARKADYQAVTTDAQETQFSMLKQLELTHEMHLELMAHCRQCGIGFFSTGFDVQSVDYLVSLGQDLLKIPSGEITNLPYLRHIGALGKSLILSTGMSTLGDVEAALAVLEYAGTPRSQVTVLHCTTEYPAPLEEVNLRAMQTLAAALDVAVGYSDHTLGIEVAIAAVALGASVIEKHFTLDRALPGPDHKASLLPAEMKAMVAAIRNVEKAIGDGVKRVTPSESVNRVAGRKSIVAARPIAAGELYSEANLTTKRPGSGISPMRWNDLIGNRAYRDFGMDELID
jgi:N,N'-diacetyllegionaminate synthase